MTKLIIPNYGNPDTEFKSASGLLLAKGYRRVVHGGRGAYVEFNEENIVKYNFYIPIEESWRKYTSIAFYIEHRSKDESYVKLYQQLMEVSYADYIIGKYYIAPDDLYIINACVAIKMEQNTLESFLES